MKPFSPAEARASHQGTIPDVIFEVVNMFLADGGGKQVVVSQPAVVAELKKRMEEDDFKQIFKRNWLDIEPLYEKVGWKVSYDKPGYNETYDASWTFTPKKAVTR